MNIHTSVQTHVHTQICNINTYKMGQPASSRPSVIILFHILLDLGSQAQMPVPSNTATHTLLLDHRISDETAESEEKAVCDFFFLPFPWVRHATEKRSSPQLHCLERHMKAGRLWLVLSPAPEGRDFCDSQECTRQATLPSEHVGSAILHKCSRTYCAPTPL